MTEQLEIMEVSKAEKLMQSGCPFCKNWIRYAKKNKIPYAVMDMDSRDVIGLLDKRGALANE